MSFIEVNNGMEKIYIIKRVSIDKETTDHSVKSLAVYCTISSPQIVKDFLKIKAI